MSFPRSIVVMGVSGTGKTTVGRALAERLGMPFVEGDDLHPESNVRKMASGVPLDDADRAPWLDRVAAAIAEQPVVATCSALKRAYRDRLRSTAPDLALVFLHGEPGVLAERMGTRRGHYMPTRLLDSQLATLESPDPEENAISVDVAPAPDEIVAAVLEALERRVDA